MIVVKVLIALVCIIAIAVVYAFVCVRAVIWVEELCRYIAFEQHQEEQTDNTQEENATAR